MLDQSFSVDNFRKILDLENRKGNYLEGKYFPNHETLTGIIKDCNKQIREKKRSKCASEDELKELYDKRNTLKEQKEDQLNAALQAVSDQVATSSFKIELSKNDIPSEKSLYVVKDSPEHYFTIKQLQSNVWHLFGVKQANRLEIISQVKVLLCDKFPKYVLRTDINDFYESIPRGPLLKIINGNNLLTPFSRKILKQILFRYTKLSGSNKGVPRGVGVSAYLAELYMRDIDQKIMSLSGISYYARYVDDIIIIFVPTIDGQERDYLKDIKNVIEGKFCLKLNDTKTQCFDLRNVPTTHRLEYLGYEIYFGDGKLKTKFTLKKLNRYKRRIDLTLESYLNLSKVNEKKARKLLVKRIRFLTGNTRLRNSKNNILVGIYHSNSQLTEKEDLVDLDDYLKSEINVKINTSHLKNRLRKYSFKAGFEGRRFSSFKPHELQEIVKAWK